ncbi:MAG TPA: hypothetical protein VM537_17505 [Anaerolineae bacterium]|nr:hypothetical protein [Anaerolineae bacterium]
MSTWDSIKPFVSKFAPMIGTALGGPLGGAAGALVASALGIKDADPKSVAQAIQSGTLTGDQIIALRQAEDQFTLQMKQIDVNSVEDMAKLAVEDRESARQREIAVKDRTPQILAYGVTLGFFSVLAFILWKGLPEQNEAAKNVLLILVGSLGTAWTQNIMGYYFGSSSGADRGQELLHQSSPVQKDK